MTAGAFARNDRPTSPAGVQGSPCISKVWSGANDTKHRAFNAYSMCKLYATHTQLSQPNLYYPFVPPTFFLTRGLPHFDMVKAERDTHDGNTFLRAQSKCIDRIKNHGFYAGNALAEPDETLVMLINSVRAAQNALLAGLKGDWNGFMRSLPRIIGTPRQLAGAKKKFEQAQKSGSISDIWLSMQFGWLPAIGAVYDAIDAIDGSKEYARSSLFTGVATAAPRYRRMDLVGGVDYSLGLIRETAKCRVVVKPEIDPWSLAGFNKETWLSVAWERVPFSFVFDWFIPVGQMLENWSSLSNFSTSIQRTCFKRMTGGEAQTQADYTKPLNVPPNTQWSRGKTSWEAVSLVREVLPPWYFTIPSVKPWKKSLSDGHLRNAAALIFSLTQDSKYQAARYASSGGLLGASFL